jgi:hypothetical protein
LKYDTLENIVIFLLVLCVFFLWLYYKQRKLAQMAEAAAYFLGQLNVGVSADIAARQSILFTKADPKMVKEFLDVLQPICNQWAAVYKEAHKQAVEEFNQQLKKQGEGFRFNLDGSLDYEPPK